MLLRDFSALLFLLPFPNPAQAGKWSQTMPPAASPPPRKTSPFALPKGINIAKKICYDYQKDYEEEL
ncbi:hypothetical protein AALG83_04215 [Christensenellaceae bacterium 44-20]